MKQSGHTYNPMHLQGGMNQASKEEEGPQNLQLHAGATMHAALWIKSI